MILQTENLSKAFGGLRAVDKITLGVREGDLHAVIGPNGAGKTTFFNLVSKYLDPDEGTVIFEGKDLTKLPPDQICRRGLVRTFQHTSIYPTLTVFESVQIAVLTRKGRPLDLFHPIGNMFGGEVADILDKIGLTSQADLRSDALSHGNKKRLELAIALGSGPKLLLLDEPTAAVGVKETGRIMELLRELHDSMKLAILFTEHDMSVVFNIAERVTVFHEGRIIADGTPDEIKKDEEVQRVYLGVAA